MEEKTYIQKLQDPRWQRKRLEILQRDEFRCKHCGADDKPLQIHHIAYNFQDPWEIEPRLLISLCSDCHNYETVAVKAAFSKLIQTIKLAGFTSGEVELLTMVFEGENIIKPSPHCLDVIINSVRDHNQFALQQSRIDGKAGKK